jgi:hypothetical protein
MADSLAPSSESNPIAFQMSLARDMKARVITPSEICGLDAGCLNQLLVGDSDAWSAGSLRLPDGEVVVVLNPNHPATRKCATLMEELSHLHLGHRPTQLILIDGGPAFRSFKKSQETEAYWVGAARISSKSSARTRE